MTRVGSGPTEDTALTLGDALRSAPLVAVVVPVLDAPDCSGVGWRHLALEPYDPQRSGGLIRGYRALHLPSPAPPAAPYYLMGGTLGATRVVDLKKVCIPFESEANAQVDWVLPLRDRDEATAWNEWLTHRACD